jgi:hypothetical protein
MTDFRTCTVGLRDLVVKDGGDYTFEGEIIGVFTKRSGAIRYAVEDDRGLILILNRSQFMLVPSIHDFQGQGDEPVA